MDRGDNNAPPQFVQHPVSQVTVNEGDSIILKAVVRPAGDPTLDVQWLKNGVVLSACDLLDNSELLEFEDSI
ncbi:unnamed protein product [Rodentolepis nana]|uniref:Ig-like domain-containing protein n=1 Tax=Rodentolepis nana TaxID=102285 RepID=A0A0R3T5K6_RODNA|nr:unnamed protein product [Rodentolepis nana]